MLRRWRRTDRERARDAHTLSVDERRVAWALCSALLEYPSADLLARLDDLTAAAGELPGACRAPLLAVIDHLRGNDLMALQKQYVETLDHTRKCSLYLTYFNYGDTRRRGVALVEFKQAYRRGGVEFDDSDELPDHLAVVLQFGAQVDHDGAWQLLLDHRAGVEMLRLALTGWDDGAGSPWGHVLVALCATLPPLKGEEADAVRRLVEQGPPAEEVGLEPYSFDPSLSPEPPVRQPEFLGMPS